MEVPEQAASALVGGGEDVGERAERGAEDAARVRGEAAEHDARAHVPQPQRAAPLARVARQRAEAVGAAGAHLDQRAEESRRRSPSERVGERERRRAPELERRRVERGEHEVAVVERDARHLARALVRAAALERQRRLRPLRRAPNPAAPGPQALQTALYGRHGARALATVGNDEATAA